jgi:hypothetical protein
MEISGWEELRRRAELAAEKVGGTGELAKQIGINRISLENFINKRESSKGRPRKLSSDQLEKLMVRLGVLRHEVQLPGGFVSADTPELMQSMAELHWKMLAIDVGREVRAMLQEIRSKSAENRPADSDSPAQGAGDSGSQR